MPSFPIPSEAGMDIYRSSRPFTALARPHTLKGKPTQAIIMIKTQYR